VSSPQAQPVPASLRAARRPRGPFALAPKRIVTESCRVLRVQDLSLSLSLSLSPRPRARPPRRFREVQMPRGGGRLMRPASAPTLPGAALSPRHQSCARLPSLADGANGAPPCRVPPSSAGGLNRLGGLPIPRARAACDCSHPSRTSNFASFSAHRLASRWADRRRTAPPAAKEFKGSASDSRPPVLSTDLRPTASRSAITLREGGDATASTTPSSTLSWEREDPTLTHLHLAAPVAVPDATPASLSSASQLGQPVDPAGITTQGEHI
jgi:hypothetical protein